MKNKLYWYFVLSILISTTIYIAQKSNVRLSNFIQFYVNDFLIIPIVLTISLVVLRWSKDNPNYNISILIILYLCFGYSIFFEYVLPKIHVRYTADVIDVALYFISGILFYFLQKKN